MIRKPCEDYTIEEIAAWKAATGSSITKPPLGIMPKYIHDEKRIDEILDAISRFGSAGVSIPVKWIEEYNGLLKRK